MKLFSRVLLMALSVLVVVPVFNASAYVRFEIPELTPVPSTPQNVVVPTTSSTGTFTLGWQPSSNFTNGYYRVEESFSFGSWRTVVSSIPTNTTRHTFSGKAPGTYRYRVIACNRPFSGSDVCSGWGYSGYVNVSVGATAPGVPATPTGPQYSSDGSYTINWGKPAGTVTHYNLQERFNSGSWATVVSSNVLSKSFSNKPEGNYEYRVRACNSAASPACSAYSNIKTTSVTITPAYAAKTSATVPNKPLPTLDGPYIHDTDFGITAGNGGVSGGSASYSIPITVAPGRNGMQPSVSLNYSSQSGNGVVGMGWSLGVGSAISRCGRTEAQDGIIGGVTYSNTTDKLCYEGQRLIATYDSGSFGRYRTELDSFVKVTRIGYINDSNVKFTVETKGGLVRYYGTTANSHVKPTGAPASLSWLLEQERDRAGNTIDYEYTNFGNGEVLLDHILYTGTATTPGNRKVSFNYIQRTDFSSSYLAGGLTRQTKILNKIETFYNNSLIRSYKLHHEPSSASGKSLLKWVKECSSSGDSNCFAPIEFNWHDDAMQYQIEKLGYRNSSGTLIPQLQSKRKIEEVMPHGDRDGDGGLDWAHWSMDAEGKYLGDPGTESQTCQRNSFTMRMVCVDADFDRDGTTDNWKIESNILKISYNGVSYFNTPIALNYKSYLNHSADFNGDGWPDLVVDDHTGSAPVLKLYLHTGNTSSPYTSYGQVIYNYGYNTSNGGTKTSTAQFIGDTDGNGLPDFIHATFDAPGNGFQAAPQATPQFIYLTKLNSSGNVYMDTVNITSHALTASGFEYFFHFFMDVNGDGLTDWLSWKGNTQNIYLSLNKGNTTFTNWQDMGAESALAVRTYIGELLPGEPVDRSYPKYHDNFRQVDLNSDGKPELLVPGRMLVKACATLTTVGATGGSSNVQYCGDQLYGNIRTDIQSRQKHEIPIWSGELDDGIYEWEAIYFEEQSNGNFIARKRTTPIIASASQNAAVDAFTNGLTDIVFTYGVRLTGDVTLSNVASHPLPSEGVYINRSLGTVNNGSGDRQYELVDTLESVKNTANGYETKWNYRPLSSRDVLSQNGPLYSTTQALETDSFYFTSSIYVVSSVETSNGVGGFNETHYRYRDAIYNYKGRGFQGFKTIIVDNPDAYAVAGIGIRSVTKFKQAFPLSGQIESMKTCEMQYADENCSSQVLSEEIYEYTSVSNHVSSIETAPITWVYANRSQSRTFDSAGGNYLNEVIQTVDDVDNYGNIKSTTTDTKNGFSHTRQQTTNTYEVNEGLWWVNKLTRSVVTSQTISGSAVYESGLDPLKKIQTDTTWTSQRLPDVVTVTPLQPVDPVLGAGKVSAVDTDYNSYGLPVAVRTYEPGSPYRQVTMNYSNNGDSVSADGYFVYELTNDLGHKTTTKTDPKFGVPDQIIDPNQLSTSMVLDPFGRVTRATPPSGTGPAVYTAIEKCGSCQPGELYRVVTYSQGNPTSIVYKDMLDRTVRTQMEGFASNSWIYTNTSYNGNGQVTFESIPSSNLNESLGTTYSNYDVQGRLGLKETDQEGGHKLSVGYTYTRYLTDIAVSDTRDGPRAMSRTYSGNGQLMQTTQTNYSTDSVTQYAYDSMGNPIVMQDANGNRIRAEYNALGQKLYVNDPNMGLKSFTYNSFGEVASEKDANGDVYSYNYDDLGRLISRKLGSTIEATFDFDTASCVGVIEKEEKPNLSSGSFSKTYDYDGLCRPDEIITNINSKAYSMRTSYDGNSGRVNSVTYPNGIKVATEYNANGYATKSYNASSNYIYHQVTAMDERLQVTNALKANGILTEVTGYHPETGQMSDIYTHATSGGVNPQRHKINYVYAGYGNLGHQIVESNWATGVDRSEEHYTYDELHRLRTSHRKINNSWDTKIYYDFDKVGNLTRKSDYGSSYQYGTSAKLTRNAGSNAAHRLSKNGGGYVYYTYDNNGNLTTVNDTVDNSQDKSLVYNAFNKPTRITKNNITSTFDYGADQMRYRQLKTGVAGGDEETIYIGKAYEEMTKGNIVTKKAYIGDAIITETVGGTLPDYKAGFVHRDRLGSVVTVTDHLGNIVDNKSYDPFGKPRKITMDYPSNLKTVAQLSGYELQTNRGYTDHEHLDDADLIHMNGRVYDYNLGRFLSVDPLIQEPGNSQSMNPYSYIMNNPLAGTDPSGYEANKTDQVAAFNVTRKRDRKSLNKFKKDTKVEGVTVNGDKFSFSASGDNGSTTLTSIQGVNLDSFFAHKIGDPSLKLLQGSGDGGNRAGFVDTSKSFTNPSTNPSTQTQPKTDTSSGSITRGILKILTYGSRAVTSVSGALLSFDVGKGSDISPEDEAKWWLESIIKKAEDRGEESITIFRTAGPTESKDIRSTRVFRLGPNNFPKQFTVMLEDAVDFQKSLPEFGNQNSNPDFALPHTIFAANISIEAAKAMTPGVITDHGRPSLILTAQTRQVLGKVNTSALSHGGIMELSTR